MTDPWVEAQSRLKEISGIIKLDKLLLTTLLHPHRTIEFDLPLLKDDGKIEIFRGYRVQHNNIRGPYKGGIRYHQKFP